MSELIPASIVSKRTRNSIREIVDHLKIPTTSSAGGDKSFISLALGDPSESRLFRQPEGLGQHLLDNIQAGKWNGYPPAVGYKVARDAIAKSYQSDLQGQGIRNGIAELSSEDVVIACGCSGALELAISALCNEGDSLLVPKPGFPLYTTICESKGISAKQYPLLPDQDWEIDLVALESLITSSSSSASNGGRVKAILINNPSNPCGSVFTSAHLKAILGVAERYNLPIIADEIYRGVVFDAVARPFIPIAALTDRVPILTCGGLAKQYVVPGWRVGWIVLHDSRVPRLSEIRIALQRLACLILGANSLAQSVIPFLLEKTHPSYYLTMNENLKRNADLCRLKLSNVPGLQPIVPQGAMYLMVKLDFTKFRTPFQSDLEFSQQLVNEELVLCLPGACFSCPNFVRLVITNPPEILEDALDRISAFCHRHSKKSTSSSK